MAFNEAVDETKPFSPNVKGGPRTDGLPIDKANRSNRINRNYEAARADKRLGVRPHCRPGRQGI